MKFVYSVLSFVKFLGSTHNNFVRYLLLYIHVIFSDTDKFHWFQIQILAHRRHCRLKVDWGRGQISVHMPDSLSVTFSSWDTVNSWNYACIKKYCLFKYLKIKNKQTNRQLQARLYKSTISKQIHAWRFLFVRLVNVYHLPTLEYIKVLHPEICLSFQICLPWHWHRDLS